MTVRVREAEAAEAYDLLATGDVDLALSLAAEAPSAADPRFTHVPLLADPLDVALPPDHRLARAARLRDTPPTAGTSGVWGQTGGARCGTERPPQTSR